MCRHIIWLVRSIRTFKYKIINMKKNILLIVVFFILINQVSLADNFVENKAYTVFCELVTEAVNLSTEAKIRHEYIIKNFDEKVGSKEIKEAYDVVFQVAPDKRYSVFKESIEEITGGVWECNNLKVYFDQYVK